MLRESEIEQEEPPPKRLLSRASDKDKNTEEMPRKLPKDGVDIVRMENLLNNSSINCSGDKKLLNSSNGTIQNVQTKDDVQAAIYDVSNADFVAIDFEFSGLFATDMNNTARSVETSSANGSTNFSQNSSTSFKRYKNMFDYYRAVSDGTQIFAPIELGIACFNFSEPKSDSPNWKLPVTSTRYCWKMQPNRLFCVQRSCLSFLRKEAGFDLNTWAVESLIVKQKACFEGFERDADGLEAVIHAMLYRPKFGEKKSDITNSALAQNKDNVEKPKPPPTRLIFHHGIFDVCHFFHAFLGNLESCPDLNTFQKAWRSLVGEKLICYDTRYIMKSCSKGSSCNFGFPGGSLSLMPLWSHFKDFVENSDNRSQGSQEGRGSSLQLHTAGGDAQLTGEIFAGIVSCAIREKNGKTGLEKENLGTGEVSAEEAANGTNGGPQQVKNFFEDEVVPIMKNWENGIAGFAAPPGYFNIVGSGKVS